MAALPTFLLCTIVGFYLDEVHGLMLGAVLGWFASWGATAFQMHIHKSVERTQSESFKALEAAQSNANKALDDIRRAVISILDAQPLPQYSQLELRPPRTQEEWDECWPRLWPLLHRRLVFGYGLTAARVDKAKEHILDQHATSHHLPKTDDELARMVEKWRASGQWAQGQQGS